MLLTGVGAAVCLLAAHVDVSSRNNVVIEAAPLKTNVLMESLASDGYSVRALFDAKDKEAALAAGLDKFVVVSSGEDAESVASRMRSRLNVVAAAADSEVQACNVIPNDPDFPQQYSLRNTGQIVNGVAGTPGADIGAPAAWDISTGSSSVAIAIIDTGVSGTHPDLAGKIVAARNFVGTDPNAWSDGNGHGTHSAGIAAARSNNNIGVAGVCWNCQLVVARVLDDQGIGTWSGVAAAIVWAADQSQVRILTLNFGGAATDAATLAAVNYASSRGKIIVAAAGNTYGGDVQYPAKFDNCIAVSATDQRDHLADFTAQGEEVDLSAPGVDVLSSFGSRGAGDGYAVLSGTSMAAPHVAGLAGLIWSINPSLSATRVRQIMESTAKDLGAQGKDPQFGSGRIDAARATFMARAMLCPSDFNLDGALDFFDYLDFVTLFSTGDRGADFNHDGVIDLFDYLDFAAAFSGGCP